MLAMSLWLNETLSNVPRESSTSKSAWIEFENARGLIWF